MGWKGGLWGKGKASLKLPPCLTRSPSDTACHSLGTAALRCRLCRALPWCPRSLLSPGPSFHRLGPVLLKIDPLTSNLLTDLFCQSLKSFWRRERLPTSVFMPEEFQGQSLTSYTVHEVAKSQTWATFTHSLKLLLALLLLLLLLLSRFSRVQLCATPWTAAHQAPLSMGFSWQEYWSGLPLPSPPSSSNLLQI